MKVILLSLAHIGNRRFNSDGVPARASLERAFPEASIESISQADLKTGSFGRRLNSLRRRRPDVFALSMESMAWQRGQNLLGLFGVLAGAKRIVMVDARGGFKSETGARILWGTPKRLVLEAIRSALAITRSRRKLRSFEQAARAKRVPYRNLLGSAPEILYLRATPGAGTQAGGASTHINGFANAVVEKGVHLRIISNDQIAGLDQRKVSVTIIPMQPVGITRAAFDLHNNLVFTKGVVGEVEQTTPSFIYQRYSRFTWAGIAASLCSGRPLFLEYNGSEVWIGRNWDAAGMFSLLERVERLNLNAAARVFVVSEVERANLLRAGIADEKIIVNPNGVDVEKFRPDVGGEETRAMLSLTPAEPLVGFIGTFGPWHGVLELAQAITAIPKDVCIRFLLVGDGTLREKTERVIREAGMTERVIFTGAVDHERVPALLDACDILVSPHVPLVDGSDFFGSPTKLFEYMAMGKGIVASCLGQIGDVLTHETTALMVEPGNVPELTAAIIRLTNSRELRRRLGEAARRKVVAHHTWKHNAERVLDAYESWLHQN